MYCIVDCGTHVADCCKAARTLCDAARRLYLLLVAICNQNNVVRISQSHGDVEVGDSQTRHMQKWIDVGCICQQSFFSFLFYGDYFGSGNKFYYRSGLSGESTCKLVAFMKFSNIAHYQKFTNILCIPQKNQSWKQHTTNTTESCGPYLPHMWKTWLFPARIYEQGIAVSLLSGVSEWV